MKKRSKKATPISPVKVEAIQISTPALAQAEDIGSYDLPPGKVLLQGVKDGKEVGKPFKTSFYTYQRAFSDPNKFILKKKA